MSSKQPIIIKKVKKGGGHGHHGGAWKVAYADFVTAMMAFFLLLWLLSSTSKEQKEGIADYFNNPTISLSKDGGGVGFMGGVDFSDQKKNTAPPLTPFTPPFQQPQSAPQQSIEELAEQAAREAENFIKERQERLEAEEAQRLQEAEEERFKDAEDQLRQAIQDVPELKELAASLIIDNTPEGLRIQIVDQDQRSMFPSGSAQMFDYANQLLGMVSKVVSKMPNKIAIGGHTDAVQFRSTSAYNNWDLSADRANASRQALIAAGVPEDHISRVSGHADRELLDKDDPSSARNRRISILLLRDAKDKKAEDQE